MSAAAKIEDSVRRILGDQGLVVSRYEASVPERLDAYLQSLGARGLNSARAIAFDGDPETLNALCRLFGPEKVQCYSDPRREVFPARGEAEGGRFVALDLALLGPIPPSTLAPWLDRAAAVLVRAKICAFWEGRADFCDLADLLAARGLRLHDVLHQPSGAPAAAPGWNFYAAFERNSDPGLPVGLALKRSRYYRISEARTLLSAPVAPLASLRRLTGRGTQGYAGGVFNPGAIDAEGGPLLLARGERSSWPVQKRSRDRYLDSCQPVFLRPSPDLTAFESQEGRWAEADRCRGNRCEDFRLFTHQGQVYANHSCIRGAAEIAEGDEVRPEAFSTAVGISRVDPKAARLVPLGPVAIDRPVGRVEKNWAMFSDGNRLRLIYSFNPYRLYAATGFPSGRFALELEHAPKFSRPEDGIVFRNSINPVAWDDRHWLHVVHQVFPEKRYVFWAVLIDRRTLKPVSISRRPLVTDRSSGAAITYVSSVLCRGEELLLFGGLDDCAIGAWRLARSSLEKQWEAIA